MSVKDLPWQELSEFYPQSYMLYIRPSLMDQSLFRIAICVGKYNAAC